jgi:proline iminopeptidase
MGMVVAALALLALATCAALLARKAAQSANAKRLRVSSPESVDEAGYVPVNGQEQWIQVRGRDRRTTT